MILGDWIEIWNNFCWTILHFVLLINWLDNIWNLNTIIVIWVYNRLNPVVIINPKIIFHQYNWKLFRKIPSKTFIPSWLVRYKGEGVQISPREDSGQTFGSGYPPQTLVVHIFWGPFFVGWKKRFFLVVHGSPPPRSHVHKLMYVHIL